MAKPELEFFDPKGIPWKLVNDDVQGLYESIISADTEDGSITRFLNSNLGPALRPWASRCMIFGKSF